MDGKSSRAYAMLLTAMVIYGTIGVFRRYIPLSSGMMAFLRGILGAAFLLVFVALRRHRLPRIGARQFWLLALTGALIGFNWILLFESYRYTTVATATMCYYMQPTIVILLSPLVLHERLTAKKLLCALAAIIGMVFISGVIGSGAAVSETNTLGVIYGLAAAALYASVILLNKKVTIADAYEKTIIQLVFASVTLIPYLLLTETSPEAPIGASAIIMVLILGIVHTGIAYALYFGSMQQLPGQSVAVLSYIDPVVALLLSALVLNERLTVLGIIGAVLIIGSAIVSETGGKSRA